MKYILDTNIFLWFVIDDKRLPKNIKKIIETSNEIIYISTASLWEIELKNSIGKLDLKDDFNTYIPKIINYYNFQILEIKMKHLFQLHKLPKYHKDPFDRIIIAQALNEKLKLLYTDKLFNNYINT